ncbi:MAG: 50S ribosomal protein L23 [Rickettsiales bacterium]|jgi:large subunit ribosomal protein L23|nr:50S ribosomal protein L23 [Rickettsiales bacterium]
MALGKEYDIIVRVITTEKSSRDLSLGKTTFEVVEEATKTDVKSAIEKIFGVKVESVNISKNDGKIKRFKGKIGQRNSVKKAIVTIEKGQNIDLTKLEV